MARIRKVATQFADPQLKRVAESVNEVGSFDIPDWQRDSTPAEIAAGVTPVNFQYPPYTGLRYSSLSDLARVAVKFYVSTTGDDNNSGLSSGSPFATIQKALDTLKRWVTVFPYANYTVSLAAGTYTEKLNVNTLRTGRIVVIEGPATTSAWSKATWASSPADVTPTAIISGSGVGDTGTGLVIGNYMWVRLKNIKITEFRSGTGIECSNRSNLILDNVHVTRCAVQCQLESYTRYSVLGGYFSGDDPDDPGNPLVNSNNDSYSFREFFQVTRDFDIAGSDDAGAIIEGSEYGIHSKESSCGKANFTDIHGTVAAVALKRGATCNVGSATLSGAIGVELQDGSASFEDNGQTDYSGCTAPIVFAKGQDFFRRRAQSNNAGRIGLQESLLGFIGEQSAHTGTTDATKIGGDLYTTLAYDYVAEGSSLRLHVVGTAELTNDSAVVTFGVGSSTWVGVTLPQNTTRFNVDFIVHVTSDGATQFCEARGVARVSGSDQAIQNSTTRTIDMSAFDFGQYVQVTLANASDSVTIQLAKLYGSQL